MNCTLLFEKIRVLFRINLNWSENKDWGNVLVLFELAYECGVVD